MTELEMLADLKLILGISGNESDAVLQLLLDTVTDKVLADTNQPYLPASARSIVVEMAADAYWLRQNAVKAETGEEAGAIASVSDNGQSVSYREGSSATVLKTVSDSFLKAYADRLAPYRRAGW